MHFCIRLYLTDFRINGYTRSLMDAKHSYALKSEYKSESGPLVENSSQIGVVETHGLVCSWVSIYILLGEPSPPPQS